MELDISEKLHGFQKYQIHGARNIGEAMELEIEAGEEAMELEISEKPWLLEEAMRLEISRSHELL